MVVIIIRWKNYTLSAAAERWPVLVAGGGGCKHQEMHHAVCESWPVYGINQLDVLISRNVLSLAG